MFNIGSVCSHLDSLCEVSALEPRLEYERVVHVVYQVDGGFRTSRPTSAHS